MGFYNVFIYHREISCTISHPFYICNNIVIPMSPVIKLLPLPNGQCRDRFGFPFSIYFYFFVEIYYGQPSKFKTVQSHNVT